MAISVSNIAAAELHTTSNSEPYDTPNFTSSSELIIACICRRGDATGPASVTYNGSGMTAVTSVGYTSNTHLSLWVAPGSGTSAFVRASGGTGQTGCHILVFETSGVDVSAGVADAVVQNDGDTTAGSGTSQTVGLPSGTPFDSDSRCVAFGHHGTNEGTSWDTNWTELTEGSFTSPDSTLSGAWTPSTFDQTAVVSWTTSISARGGVIMELKAAAASTGDRLDSYGRLGWYGV